MTIVNEHPRIEVLRSQVLGLPVSDTYRAALLQSIATYHQQIVERPDYAPDEGWDDLFALTQVAWGDALEQHLGERQHKPQETA